MSRIIVIVVMVLQSHPGGAIDITWRCSALLTCYGRGTALPLLLGPNELVDSSNIPDAELKGNSNCVKIHKGSVVE